MKSTRVRGELGPACATCKTTKKWSGTRWFCHPCRALANRVRKARLSAEQRERERVRANELRNARRAEWAPERRAAANEQVAAWRDANREQHRQLSRDWYADHSEQKRAYAAGRYSVNPEPWLANNLLRKARMLAAICEHGVDCVGPDFLAELYSRPCFYCGSTSTDADHFQPLAGGGLHCQFNLVPACGPCNGSKHARDPIEFIVGVRGDQ